MARKQKHEDHVNHEAWAIPYGDLVTLLFALFTVMYAMSSVNEGKFRVLSDALITVRRENMWLEIEINTDILFPSGSGAFSTSAEPVLDKLAEVLKPFPNP